MVIQQQKATEINRLIEEEYGAKPGNPEMIKNYQWGVTEVMKGMTEAEREEARQTAEQWNKTAPPQAVQAQ